MTRKINKTLSSVERLMQEWDWEKNQLDPATLGAQSNQAAWWKCKYGHSWEAKINNRYNGRGCPICRYRLKTSFQEQAVFFYIKNIYADAINGYTSIFKNGMELDVFIPSIKVGIEYDGKAWHNEKTINREKVKYQICQDNGIYLIRLVEKLTQGEITSDKNIVIGDAKNYKEIDNAIIDTIITLKAFSSEQCECTDYIQSIDTERDKNAIYEQFLTEYEKNSLANTYPHIAAEWNYSKNGSLTPKMFLPHSSVKVWWRCEKGHEWTAAINTRASGRNCPYCSGNYVLAGYNDLATVYPEIAEEWNYSRNGLLKPYQVTYGSGRQVWWTCKNGHEWQSPINNRTSNSHGCPYCTGEKAIVGVNDLCTINPMLAMEWHPTKNGTLSPQNFKPNSNKKVWWLCSKCGFEYQAKIADKTKGNGCRNCSNLILHPGINDLATLYPDIAHQWNYEKNGELTPDKVFPKTNKKVWWLCDKGHTWQASPNTRTAGSGCPYCAGNRVWVGFNDLETTHSEIASEWNYEKNGELTPQMVSAGSGKKVWWKCKKCGCEYQSVIGNRVNGYGCKCSGKWAQRRNKKCH